MSRFAKPFESIGTLVGELKYLDETIIDSGAALKESISNALSCADRLMEEITDARLAEFEQRHAETLAIIKERGAVGVTATADALERLYDHVEKTYLSIDQNSAVNVVKGEALLAVLGAIQREQAKFIPGE